MWAKHKQQKGFTIVELLIVVVVIGILAAIVTVAYTGITQKAYNTKVVAGANAYLKAFSLYKAAYGSYPPGPASCLGANYPNNACWAANANGTSSSLTVNATLDNSLSEFMSTKPDVGTELINIVIVNQFRAGAFYYATGSAYATSAPLIGYYLKGNGADCSMNVSQQNNEGPWTQCLIALP